MKLHFIFHFIQTAEQEEEGLWIMLFLLIAFIVLAIWAQLQPEEETHHEQMLRYYLENEPERLSYALISLVELTNPTLADQARKKYQDYKDDEIVVTFEVDVTEGNQKKRSRRISQDVKDKVWRRDEGKCVECSSNENLEFDHIIPHSKGGANTYRNIQLLCEKCNRSKSAKIG